MCIYIYIYIYMYIYFYGQRSGLGKRAREQKNERAGEWPVPSVCDTQV